MIDSDICCFSILYSYQIPEFVKLKYIITIKLPSYSNMLCRVVPPFLRGSSFIEHICSQLLSSVNKYCHDILMSSTFIWYLLGSIQTDV